MLLGSIDVARLYPPEALVVGTLFSRGLAGCSVVALKLSSQNTTLAQLPYRFQCLGESLT